jgi:hypothetical protein
VAVTGWKGIAGSSAVETVAGEGTAAAVTDS